MYIKFCVLILSVFGSRAGEASTSFSLPPLLRSPSRLSDSRASSTLNSSVDASSFDQFPLEETTARGSDDFPCRVFHPVTFPRDGHVPHDGALGSSEFPAKPAVTEWWDLGYEYVKSTPCSYANARCIGRLRVSSSRGVPFPSHHATALISYTSAFTTMLMIPSVCTPTAAVVRT